MGGPGLDFRSRVITGGMTLPLLLGESNPYGADPGFALYPEPRRASGNRLRRILGLSDEEYLAAFDRANLLDGPRWSAPRAREAALALGAGRPERTPFILLGAKVAAAFGLRFRPFSRAAVVRRLLVLPHPSGRSSGWRAPEAPERAREAVAELVAPTHPGLAARLRSR